jgi:hypothetical protein
MNTHAFRFSFPSAIALAICAAMIPAPAFAVSQSGKRHLVYSFTVGVKDNTRVASAVAPVEDASTYVQPKGKSVLGNEQREGAAYQESLFAHGQTSYAGSVDDKGQIVVDIAGLQPDGALVLSVSEAAERRSGAATDCLVYQDTNVKCAGPVFPEELAVMRTLSPKFLDPAFSDAGRHWHVDHGTQDVPSDFTVAAKADSSVTVDEQRSVTMAGSKRGTITTEAKYVYDQNRLLPTSIAEYTLVHAEQDAGHTADTTVDITASLIADSAMNGK